MNQHEILLSLKIISYIINATNVKKRLTFISGLIKKLPNTQQFCNGDVNKFIFLFSKRAYPYEHMNSWGRFDET